MLKPISSGISLFLILTLCLLLGVGRAAAETTKAEEMAEDCFTQPNRSCLLSLATEMARHQKDYRFLFNLIAMEYLAKGEIGKAKPIVFEALDAHLELHFDLASKYGRIFGLRPLLDELIEYRQEDLLLEVLDRLKPRVKKAFVGERQDDLLEIIAEYSAIIGNFEQAMSHARQIARPSSRWHCYKKLGLIIVGAGEHEEGLEVIMLIPEDDPEDARARAIQEIALELVRQGKVEKAQSLLSNGFDSFQPVKARIAIGTALVNNGLYQDALDYAEEAGDDLVREGIVDALVHADELDRALFLAGRISGRALRAAALSSVGRGFLANGDIERAQAVLKQMPKLQVWFTAGGRSIPHERYELIERLLLPVVRSGKLDEAYRLVLKNENIKRSPHAGLSLALARALSKVGRKDLALEIISNAHEELSENWPATHAPLYLLAFVQTYLDIGEEGLAWALAASFDKTSPYNHNSLILVEMVERGEIARAITWAELVPDIAKPRILMEIIRKKPKLNAQEDLWFIRKYMKDPNYRARAYIHIASRLEN